MRRVAVLLVMIAFVLAPAPQSADTHSVKVERDGRRFMVVSHLSIDAPIAAVFDVLADYDRFERLSSIFQESHFIERDANGEGVIYTRMHDCIMMYCKTIERVETMTLRAPEEIVTVVVPEQSDFRSGSSRWLLSDNGAGTDVRYEMTMEPRFWVPPLVGPFVIKRFLTRGSAVAAERLEKFALQSLPGDGES